MKSLKNLIHENRNSSIKNNLLKEKWPGREDICTSYRKGLTNLLHPERMARNRWEKDRHPKTWTKNTSRSFTEKEMGSFNVEKDSHFTDNERRAAKILLFTCQLAKTSKLDGTPLARKNSCSCTRAGVAVRQEGPWGATASPQHKLTQQLLSVNFSSEMHVTYSAEHCV